jgi:MFS family permease
VACALALFVATDSLPLAAVAAGAAGIGWGIFLVADWALACRVLPPGALATAMAIWNLAVVGPQIAAPLLAGALLLKSHILERQNWPRVAFTLAIAEIILGILWIWRLPRGLSVE